VGGKLEYFNTNGPCAAGTGSFIDQQAQRLATSIYANKTDISQDQIDGILADFISLGLKKQKTCQRSLSMYRVYEVGYDSSAEQRRTAR